MGLGGKRVAGSGGLGEWVSGGKLTAGGGEVAGRACPAPTGWRKGERVLAGRCAGVGWFRAIFVGGGVLDVPRRGQDPSLRCRGETRWQSSNGWLWKARGPGMPGPYGVVEEGEGCFPHSSHVNVENACNFYLIIIV